MDLSSTDVKSVAMVGGAGLALGVAYQLANVFIRQSTATVEFDPKVEALHLNRDMYHLFLQLMEYRSFSDKDFRQAVTAADELVLRQFQISSKKITPNMSDSQDAFMLYNTSNNAIKRMINKTMASNPRAAAIIESIQQKILVQLQACYRAVFKSISN